MNRRRFLEMGTVFTLSGAGTEQLLAQALSPGTPAGAGESSGYNPETVKA
jgi:hypothetical protein